MPSKHDRSRVTLTAKVWDAEINDYTHERNIRNVRVIYVADLPDDADVKIVILEGEMWSTKETSWVNVYGELGMRMLPGQTISPQAPVLVPFASLSEVEWSTNRFTQLFAVAHRSL